MKKRLRKKLRLGEFREYGFEVSFRLPREMSDDETLNFGDVFLEEAIESVGLMCGGRCGHDWDVFMAGSRRRPVGDRDRVDIRRWLESRREVSNVEVGPLVDAWHSV